MAADVLPSRENEPAFLRIGIDLGGTKIAGIALTRDGKWSPIRRIPTPREDYAATLAAIAGLVAELAAETGATGLPDESVAVGIGMPGSISPVTARVQNANSTWLNDRDLAADLQAVLPHRLAFANDADCFALSEATDGAGAGARSVFGVIIGTGCGAGVVIGSQPLAGGNRIAGEWGHNPLPWPRPEEFPGPECWCGRRGCLETWLSGPGMAADHARQTGRSATAEAIAAAARSGEESAVATLERHAGRLARGLAHVVNILDPEVIVLGGGLSAMPHLYDTLPALVAPHVFASRPMIMIRPPTWGPASGVRGAAWLAT